MRKTVVSSYWSFGVDTRFLLHSRSGYPIHKDGFILTTFDRFFKALDALGLAVTKRAAWELSQLFEELKQTPKDALLSPEQAVRLTELMVAIEKTLRAELQGSAAYVVTPKVLDVNKLVDNVPGLFGPDVFNSLPDIARYDFSEAGKCIAFERPTAAAFHLLRGTESVLRDFYERMVRRQRVLSRMWGPVVLDLRKRPSGSKYAALYNNLDSIREHYRNPTQHPEKIYDISEVQDLWSLCIEVVNRMARILIEEKR